MMDRALLISRLVDHAALWHGDTEIVTLRTGLPDRRGTYRELRARSAQLAHALAQRLHAQPGDRIATFAWNSQRHLELYYAVSGSGAVLHTINPRLFAPQIVYIANHARDRFMFVDADLVPVLEPLAAQLTTVERFVVLCDEAEMPAMSLPNAIAYETLIAGMPDDITWPELDERTASSLCYTSGTTGNPARRCCTPSRRRRRGRRARARTPRSCPSCRCFTRTHGGCHISRRCKARSSCSPTRTSTRRSSTTRSSASRSR